MTLELSLATTKMSRLKCDLPYIAEEMAIEHVANFLVGQGFGYAHSKDVAKQAWDLV